jgi:hypothetical protein
MSASAGLVSLGAVAAIGIGFLAFSFGRVHTLEYALDWNHLRQVSSDTFKECDFHPPLTLYTLSIERLLVRRRSLVVSTFWVLRGIASSYIQVPSSAFVDLLDQAHHSPPIFQSGTLQNMVFSTSDSPSDELHTRTAE